MVITQFALIGATMLHYRQERSGAGTPLVFINSLGSDLRIWDGVIAAFAKRHPVIGYDKRGHGLSDCPSGPYTLRDHTTDLAGLLTYLEVPNAILIGVSVGGMIALDFALSYPERVKALVLCDTGAKIGTPDYWAERIAAVREKGLEPLAGAILTRWFSSAFAQVDPATYRGYYNMLTRTPVAGYVATCEALRDADLRDAVQAIQTPAFVLCGAQDLATPPSLGRELAAVLPNAHFDLIEGAGHLPSLEQSATLAVMIEQFLEGVERDRRET